MRANKIFSIIWLRLRRTRKSKSYKTSIYLGLLYKLSLEQLYETYFFTHFIR
jgi:hypothetical protein